MGLQHAAALLLLAASSAEAGRLTGSLGMGGRFRQVHETPQMGALNCTWRYVEQKLDHFGSLEATFQQRYCIYDKYWKAASEAGFENTNGEQAPIFFYVGNESPVEEYVNNTGLMWDQGEKMGALIVFGEHRYEGKSVPKMHGVPACLSYCTSAQALADYVVLLADLKKDYKTDAPVIGFGGSYGGMLAGWMRMKYPEVLTGAIAASAAVVGFPRELGTKNLDASFATITNGVRAVPGGAPEHCFDNLRNVWPLIKEVGKTQLGQQLLSTAARRCKVTSPDDILAWGQNPWFFMAEGDYPFPTTYITFSVGDGMTPLPAWPMRVACSQGLEKDYGIKFNGSSKDVKFDLQLGDIRVNVDWDKNTGNGADLTEAQIKASGVLDLVRGMTDGAGVWYNLTKDKTCYSGVQGEHADWRDVMADQRDLARATLDAVYDAPEPPRAVQAKDEKCESCPVCENCPRCPLCDRENVSPCTYNDSTPVGPMFAWNPICCNENLYLANLIVQGVGRDLYWPPNVPKDYTVNSVIGPHKPLKGCYPQFDPQGLFGTPKYKDNWAEWIQAYYAHDDVSKHSNIVWSNGALDAWAGAGVFAKGASFDGPPLQNITADGSSIAIVIEQGAHHLDLFFPTKADPPCVLKARKIEVQKIREWSQAHYDKLSGHAQ